MTEDLATHGRSRRTFLAQTAAAGLTAGFLGHSSSAEAGTSDNARIVQIEHSGATTGKTSLDDEVVKTMIDKALMTYAGTASATEALAKYFTKDQKIAIKINTLGSPYSSVNPVVAFHLAQRLLDMGASRQNVRIFDQYITRMKKGRYRLRRNDERVWVTNHLGRDPEVQSYTLGKREVKFHWDKMIVWADAVLNVCIPKDHDLTGVTGAMKNMAMGVVKPTAKYDANTRNPGHYTIVPRFHANHCDPAIPWLYSQPMIKGKVKLIVADALRVLYHGGPQDKARYRELHNQIWVAEDPVAVDRTIHVLVNGLRKKHGMDPVEEDLFRGKTRLPHFIATAAKDYKLGIDDPARIVLDHQSLG